jgi:hypothetical protein
MEKAKATARSVALASEYTLHQLAWGKQGREATLRSYSNSYSNIQINRALRFDLIQVI